LYIIKGDPEVINVFVIRINPTSLIMEALPFSETSVTNLYLASSLTAVVRELALYRLLTVKAYSATEKGVFFLNS
jgi:hypothetical protein